MPSPSRQIATHVLMRVAEDRAFASAALDAELRRVKVDRRDAALATEIVYGTLRLLIGLDDRLRALMTRPDTALDGFVHAALRAAAYQLLYLDRVPPHAVVNDTVEIVRRERGQKLGNFANAILRKLAAGPATERPNDRGLHVPPWVEQSFAAALGSERAQSLLRARLLPPPTGLRVTPGIDREAVAAEVGAERPEAEVELGTLSPLAVLFRRGGDARSLGAYASGRLTVQEQGAQAVALLAGVEEGERVADLCAGRGGKAGLFASQVGSAGHLTAVDLHEGKLERIAPECERLAVDGARVSIEVVDLTVGTADLPQDFDRVIVDAPCTGLGTLHRRPELLLRLSEADPSRMAETQLAILRHAARLVRPGGVLVFAVCSPSHEEGAAVAAAFEAACPGFRRHPAAWPLPAPPPDADGFVRLGPWVGDCDAYQVVRWLRST